MSAVVVVQDPAKPSKAAVEARVGGAWQRLGMLDGGYTELRAPQGAIDGIRLAWAQGASAPTVFEIAGWVEEPAEVVIAPDELLVEPGKEGATAAVTVTGHSVQRRKGTLAVVVPSGWKADPARRDITVGRGQPIVVPVRLTASAGATAAGEMKVTVEAKPEVATASAKVRLVPPVDDENLARTGWRRHPASSRISRSSLLPPRWTATPPRAGHPSTPTTSGSRWSSPSRRASVRPFSSGRQPARAPMRSRGQPTARRGGPCRRSTPATVAGMRRRFDSEDPVKFVRMQGVTRATSFGYSLYEFEVYGVR